GLELLEVPVHVLGGRLRDQLPGELRRVPGGPVDRVVRRAGGGRVARQQGRRGEGGRARHGQKPAGSAVSDVHKGSLRYGRRSGKTSDRGGFWERGAEPLGRFPPT